VNRILHVLNLWDHRERVVDFSSLLDRPDERAVPREEDEGVDRVVFCDVARGACDAELRVRFELDDGVENCVLGLVAVR
jgi:hypothetical protein